MSRTGRKPITLPSGVDVLIDDHCISVKGPHGELEHKIPEGIKVEQTDGELLVTRISDSKGHRSLHGLTRSLISNMVEGVTNKFTKTLEIIGVGYRAAMQGSKLSLSVGYSHPVLFEVEDNINVEVSGNTKIIVSGIDRQQVGNYAAKIRRVRPPEPYKGKGIKYDNEQIRRKAGKSGK